MVYLGSTLKFLNGATGTIRDGTLDLTGGEGLCASANCTVTFDARQDKFILAVRQNLMTKVETDADAP